MTGIKIVKTESRLSGWCDLKKYDSFKNASISDWHTAISVRCDLREEIECAVLLKSLKDNCISVVPSKIVSPCFPKMIVSENVLDHLRYNLECAPQHEMFASCKKIINKIAEDPLQCFLRKPYKFAWFDEYSCDDKERAGVPEEIKSHINNILKRKNNNNRCVRMALVSEIEYEFRNRAVSFPKANGGGGYVVDNFSGGPDDAPTILCIGNDLNALKQWELGQTPYDDVAKNDSIDGRLLLSIDPQYPIELIIRELKILLRKRKCPTFTKTTEVTAKKIFDGWGECYLLAYIDLCLWSALNSAPMVSVHKFAKHAANLNGSDKVDGIEKAVGRNISKFFDPLLLKSIESLSMEHGNEVYYSSGLNSLLQAK